MTDFAGPARKYTGKLKVGGGPVPFKTWRDKDRPSTTNGASLRPERKPGLPSSHPRG
jgi:hypothetical protein